MSEHHGFPSPLALAIQGGLMVTTWVTAALDLQLSVIVHIITIIATLVTLALSFVTNRKKIKHRWNEWMEEIKNSRKPPIL